MSQSYLICGFLGAGKTTFSKKLVLETGAQYFNIDECVVKLFSKSEYENNWEQCVEAATNAIWNKIKSCAKNGQHAILDAGFWSHAERDDARKHASETRMSPVLYYVYAPDEILKQRISQRHGKIAQNNIKNFDKTKNLFEVPDASENFILINNF